MDDPTNTEGQATVNEPTEVAQAEDPAIPEQTKEIFEENTSLLESKDDSAPASTLSCFLEAYKETPKALSKGY